MKNSDLDKNKPLVSIIIPAYNEGGAILDVVEGLARLYPNYEILVVDDGSTDNTVGALKGQKCRLISHQVNRGYGASWKTGIASASAEIVVFYDGDGQFDPLDVGRLVDELNSSDADLVIAQRGADSHAPLSRRPGKAVLAAVANFLVKKKILDLNCGLRAARKNVIRRYTHLFPEGFSASTTSTIAFIKRGYKISHIPIRVTKRIGTSTVRPIADGFSTILSMIRLIALFDPLRIFLSFSLVLFVTAIGYSTFEIMFSGLGVPVLGAVLLLSSILFFAIGIISDQISQLRLERYEKYETKDH